MSEPFNPYYSPDRLGLEMISFDEPGLSWKYNTCAFFKTTDGRIFMAQDSGCSCPTPFEHYDADTMDECIQKMTRIADYADAEAQLKSWGRNYDHRSWITDRDLDQLRSFIQ